MRNLQTRIVDTVMYVGLLLTSLMLYVENPNHPIIIIGLCLIFSLIQIFRYGIWELDVFRPLSLILIGIEWGAAFLIQIVDGSFLPQVFFFILIGEITFRSPRTFSIPFAVLCYVGFVIGVGFHHHFREIGFVVPRVLEYVLIWGFSSMTRAVIFQKEQLNETYEKLKKATLKLEENILMEERMRLSREIHDSVGHTLSTTMIGIETSRQLLLHDKKSRAVSQLENIHSQMKQSLNDVRTSVHTLYEQHTFIHFEDNLHTLMDETRTHSQVNIDAFLSPNLPQLSPHQQLTVYRALQEGLTNGIRHGSSTYFQFSLTCENNYVFFDLQDHGHLPKKVDEGLGLTAMRERVTFIDGTLQLARTDDGGARLRIDFPLVSEKDRPEAKGGTF